MQRDPFCRLGMDAVLLAAFLSPSKAQAICDLGCGGGAVAMLLAARYTSARIDGVELQPAAAALMEENIARNSLGGRVRAIPADLRALEGVLPAGAYTGVVCNPPYFAAGSGKTAVGARQTERCDTQADLAAVCAAAAWLLRSGGELAVVYRAERLCDLLAAMRAAGIEPKRLRYVQHSVRKAPKLLLVSGRKHAGPGLKTEPPLLIHEEDGAFSEAYRKAYRGESI